MNNYDCTYAALEAHRAGGGWDPKAVTRDLLHQLGLDPKGEAKNATPVADPLEAEVAQAEALAVEASDKATIAQHKANELRVKLDASNKAAAEHKAKPIPATTPATEKVVLPPPPAAVQTSRDESRKSG